MGEGVVGRNLLARNLSTTMTVDNDLIIQWVKCDIQIWTPREFACFSMGNSMLLAPVDFVLHNEGFAVKFANFIRSFLAILIFD